MEPSLTTIESGVIFMEHTKSMSCLSPSGLRENFGALPS